MTLAYQSEGSAAVYRFILVSSETRPQVLEPVRQSGVCGILPKPFSEAQLLCALRATLDYLDDDASLENAGIDLENLRVLKKILQPN
jgi:two-component system chemotaxis response regulator CheY